MLQGSSFHASRVLPDSSTVHAKGCPRHRRHCEARGNGAEHPVPETARREGKKRFLHDRRPRATPDLEDHLTPAQFRQVGRRYFPHAGTLYIELTDEAQVEPVCTALQSFGDINRVPHDEFLSNRVAAEKHKKDCQDTLGLKTHTGFCLIDETYAAYHSH